MFPEFNYDPEPPPTEVGASEKLPPEERAKLDQVFKLLLKPEERDRLERLLLSRLAERKPELNAHWAELNGHWGYEDGFYRFYHGSFKVYYVQSSTEKAVALLRSLLPERELNETFTTIIRDGTGKEFDLSHNRDWLEHSAPILLAFAHVRVMVEMLVRYGNLVKTP